MINKINYTHEMEEQDKLWEKESEDVDAMERLFSEIVEEAKNKGFKGIAHIYDGNGEKLIEIFENEEQQNLANLGKIDVSCFGHCKPLINYLETIINN